MKEKTILENYTQSDFDFKGNKGSGFFSLSCGKASDSLEYIFDEEFYLEVYLDNGAFNDLLGKIYHHEFEAIIVRANLGGLKGLYAEKPNGVYTDNGFITDGQAYRLLYEKGNVKNYNEMPANFDSLTSVSKDNPFIVDVYYSSQKLKKTIIEKNKNSHITEQQQNIDTIKSTTSSLKFNLIILYILVFIIASISLSFFNLDFVSSFLQLHQLSQMLDLD